MNTNNIRTCSALAAALLRAGASLAADIQYAADGSSGTYGGQGFGIAVDVATPASGVTIQYSTSENGPWQDEEIKYTNACPATPIWFKISAEGYSSVTNSRTVAIAPKQLTEEFVWLTLPTQDYVYDGTAKTPKYTCGDGYPSIITSNDVDIAFMDNVNAGTATAIFTGKRNYTGTVEEEFDIYPAPFPISGDDEPGDGEVPEGGLSKFDTTTVYDGLGHTIDTAALVTAFSEIVGDEFGVEYVAEIPGVVVDNPQWSATPPMYTNAGVYRVLYKVAKANYEDFVHPALVTITQRPLTIVADAKSKTFGANDPQLTYTATGLVAGDAITGALTREGGNAAGTYAILQGTLTAGDNYDIDYTGANFTINPATIQYAADGSSGTYGGRGFGIAVDVATPASGATIQYSTSENGPWQDEEIKYTNACPATPIWFKISAEGYSSVTNSRTVAIAPKQLTDEFVWLTLPTQSYVYDGTAKTPKFTCGDGYPSIITSNDVDIAFSDNVNAGTATATFTGKRNYTGTVEEEFDIGKAPLVIGAEAKTKVFGEDDPTLTYTNSALFGTDRIIGALAREEGNAVGTYAILQGTLTAGENYEISYVGADLTILAPPNAIWYVDATNGVDTADGFSWATAKKTIQAAVNLAVDGNQIIVTNGVYTKEGNASRAVVFNSRNVDVLIRSVNGPETTILDGLGVRRCVKMADDASSPSDSSFRFNLKGSVEGFTIQNGSNGNCGGASHALLRRCIIKNNKGVVDSGGIVHCIAENCLIVDNSTDCQGNSSHPGGAARHSVLINCTVANNSNANLNNDPICPGGIANCVAINTILHGNTVAGEVKDVASVVATNSCFADAPDENGNIASDPLFGDAAHGDYRLSAASPCIDAGDSGLAPAGTDLAGNPRIVGNAVDMGCYECLSISLADPSITVALEGGPFTYDGTAHEPAATVKDGAVALVAGRDYSVSYLDNVNAGTARAIVSGMGVYFGSRTNEFDIAKRPLTIVADAKSKTFGAADPALTYTATGLVAGDAISGALVRDAGNAVGRYAIRQGTLAAGRNYTIAFTGAFLTIAEANKVFTVAVGKWGRVQVVINGKAQTVGPNVTKRIAVASGANVKATAVPDAGFSAAGAASVTYGSFTKDATASFAFVPKLQGATIRWKFSAGVGRYFAQISIPSYAGYNEALGGLSFIFADRKDAAGTLFAQLWDVSKKAPSLALVKDGGVAYRGVGLGAAAFAGKGGGTRVVFGVSNATLAKADKIVLAGERKIGMYVRNRVNPSRGNESAADVGSFTGCLTWTTAGKRYYLPIVQGAANGPVSTTAAAARPSVPTYVIVFNANGGRGAMASQAVSRGAKAQLKACAFTRNGYTFAGWAKSAALAQKGTVAYRNKAAVKNLAAAGKSVTLYAVWKRK